jgi:hypothetical protein
MAALSVIFAVAVGEDAQLEEVHEPFLIMRFVKRTPEGASPCPPLTKNRAALPTPRSINPALLKMSLHAELLFEKPAPLMSHQRPEAILTCLR